jgi:hypothetical protein
MTNRKSDIHVENHGSIVLLGGNTRRGRKWLDTNVSKEGFQPYLPAQFLCEPRYVGTIITGAQADGLKVG